MTKQEMEKLDRMIKGLEKRVSINGVRIEVLKAQVEEDKDRIEELLAWYKGFSEQDLSEMEEVEDNGSYADQAADYWGGQEP